VGHERNVGGVERPVRYTLGTLLVLVSAVLVLFPMLDGLANYGLLAVMLVSGLYLIYEARVQYCPLNFAAAGAGTAGTDPPHVGRPAGRDGGRPRNHSRYPGAATSRWQA
jgi:hypothetical protein